MMIFLSGLCHTSNLHASPEFLPEGQDTRKQRGTNGHTLHGLWLQCELGELHHGTENQRRRRALYCWSQGQGETHRQRLSWKTAAVDMVNYHGDYNHRWIISIDHDHIMTYTVICLIFIKMVGNHGWQRLLGVDSGWWWVRMVDSAWWWLTIDIG